VFLKRPGTVWPSLLTPDVFFFKDPGPVAPKSLVFKLRSGLSERLDFFNPFRLSFVYFLGDSLIKGGVLLVEVVRGF